METNIRIENNAGACHIDIEGTIGVPEAWQFDEPEQRIATYDRFREAVARIGEIEAPEVVVNIRSTGGDVNDALLIHDALRRIDGRITTRCYGYTASAATIIAQAASEGCREISANALYLIHQSNCSTEGNAAELSGKLELLQQTDRRLAELYATRAGRETAEFEALMNENNGNGRWLSPEETISERRRAAARRLRPRKPSTGRNRPARDRARTPPTAKPSARPTNWPMRKMRSSSGSKARIPQRPFRTTASADRPVRRCGG